MLSKGGCSVKGVDDKWSENNRDNHIRGQNVIFASGAP
jgi:hypothetical protein